MATANSDRIEKTASDHPRITVCPVSMTWDRPRCKFAILASIPAAMMPIRALIMNRPATVTAIMVTRNGQFPASPATVPASRVCSMVWKSSSTKPLCPSAAASPLRRLKMRDHRGERQDQNQAGSTEPRDQGRGTARHRVVEGVSDASGATDAGASPLGRGRAGRDRGLGAVAQRATGLTQGSLRGVPTCPQGPRRQGDVTRLAEPRRFVLHPRAEQEIWGIDPVLPQGFPTERGRTSADLRVRLPVSVTCGR